MDINHYCMDHGIKYQFPKVFLLFFSGIFIYFLVDRSDLIVYSQEHYSFAFKWGSKGEGNSQFERPHDIEFDSSGNSYVTDRDLHNVQKFTHDGDFIKKWGSKGNQDGQFKQPYSISIDPSDHIYVVDKNNHRIQIFDVEGNFLAKIDSAIGSSNTSFNNPEDMARDPSTGNIYLTDTYNNRIVKLDKNYNFILEWGKVGEGPGEFDHPHGIGVDSFGNVYVNDLNSPRIQKFDSEGQFIKQWGSEGTGPGELTPPLEHLFVDESDYVWLVDGEANPRIQKFDTEGNFVTTVGSGPCIIEEEVKKDPVRMTEPLMCDGELHQPEHAFIDTEGNLYVIDRGNQRIVVYSPK
jgi:tripartite motif-containing protein 71